MHEARHRATRISARAGFATIFEGAEGAVIQEFRQLPDVTDLRRNNGAARGGRGGWRSAIAGRGADWIKLR